MTELLRPWKLATLAIGIILLIAGSFIYRAPDWDIPVSIIMALVAYIAAPWCMRVLMERRWRAGPVALLLTWFGVDGCYALYWSAVDPRALELMRDANAPASLSLFMAVGLLWLPRASIGELWGTTAARIREIPRFLNGWVTAGSGTRTSPSSHQVPEHRLIVLDVEDH